MISLKLILMKIKNYYLYIMNLIIYNMVTIDFEKTAPFVIRFVFDKVKMMENNIIMDDIYLAIMKYFDGDNKINYCLSDDNSKELIGRISISEDMEGDEQENGLYDQTNVISIFKDIMNDLLENVVIKGIPKYK